MSDRFDLIVAATDQSVAQFRLYDDHGALLAEHKVDFATIRAGLRDGLFDLREHVRRYAEVVDQTRAVAEVGQCIAEQVLGDAVFSALWRPEHQRTLRIQLPGAGDADHPLAAALARVPWEIARPAADQPTLAERNLLVRVVHDLKQPASEPLRLDADEPLRVLFVFAEARGSRPLGVRAERLALLHLLQREVYPQRRVEAQVLCHGVTRAQLREQIRTHGGYHLLHWSGHGHQNLLELAGVDGQPDHLSGEELLALCHEAGGFLPRLVFLSACHSGSIVSVRDWDDFRAANAGLAPRHAEEANPTRDADGSADAGTLERKLDTTEQPGFTGTAHALLHGGVAEVVAMRYAVSDDYARDLAVELYRALLADARPKNAAAALTLARRALQSTHTPNAGRYAACDHATPLLYGAEQPAFALPAGPSRLLNPRNPCLHDIDEFQPQAHPHFVGRTWELARLGADFIGTTRDARTHAAALITGLGGMGKTALVAEVLALWRDRFQWVLLYQAKPHALALDTVLRDIHLRLNTELGLYHQHVKQHPADAVYRDAEPGFDGDARFERLARNLLRAMKSEPILLVLDNFETQLAAADVDSGDTGAEAHCTDPAWDHLLHLLAGKLVGSPSRLLVTSRRPLAVLAPDHTCRLALGPLPALEAAHFLRQHPVLSAWLFSSKPADAARAYRLLDASRFHPLLMDRLARLATQPGAAGTLEAALTALEGSAGHAALPALFAARPGDAAELAYLENALVLSIDLLISELPLDARQVLWLVALTNQPEPGALLQAVWLGEADEETQTARRLKALPPPAPQRASLLPPLARLEALGLVQRADTAANNTTETTDDLRALASVWSCHELVRERILAWMDTRLADRGERDATHWYSVLAAHLQAVFEAKRHQDMTRALVFGSRAVVYTVQTADWERLGDFTSRIVTGTSDRRLLEGLLPYLQAAVDAAPEGRTRWCCLTNLADTLNRTSRPDASLPFYDRAATLAQQVADAGGEGAAQAWSDLGTIQGNAANAMLTIGDLEGARQRRINAAEAGRRGRSQVVALASELEVLRINVLQGRAEQVRPEIEAKLEQLAQWWRAYRAGQTATGAPDAEYLARAYIAALDIAEDVDRTHRDWQSALRRLDTILDVKRAMLLPAVDVANTQVNRANVLAELPGRFAEAKVELQSCLQIFRGNPARAAATLASLASLYRKEGDTEQAVTLGRQALATREQLPDPNDRATSHYNLANYLKRLATPESLAEAPLHRLAALVYQLATGSSEDARISSFNYARDFRRAQASGATVAIPHVHDLIADPAFEPLARWLRRQQVDLAALQTGIDEFLTQALTLAQDDSQWPT